MGKLKYLSILVLINIVFTSCIVPSYISYEDTRRERKDENFVVKVYSQEQLNVNDYKIIGEISVEGCSCEIEKMLKEIKDTVKEVGGEAIIDLSLGDGVGGRISTDTYLISGKVIVFIKNKVVQ
jgi:hypothetical protein